MTAIDTSVLLSYYQTRSGAAGRGSAPAASAKAPTPPWDVTTTSKPVQASELVRQALAGRTFIEEGAAQLDVKGASDDYRKLFAAYGGLNRLAALAERATAKGVGDAEVAQLNRRFAVGVKQVSAYVDGLDLDKLRLIETRQMGTAKGQAFSTGKSDYVTAPLHAGSASTSVAAFAGAVVFDVTVAKLNGAPQTMRVDLADMGSEPRTMSGVVSFINGRLEAAGVASRFANHRIPAVPQTTTVGGRTVTLSAGQDQYALKLKTATGEAVSFSAPDQGGAAYVVQATGKDGAAGRQLLKLQTDGLAPTPAARPGEAYAPQGRVFAAGLDKAVAAVRASQVGPDGSLYTLGEVTAAADGQAIKGARDVVLSRYDSAGTLLWTRTLGAADQASGMSLAVGADGRIAVAGAVTGRLTVGETVIDATKPDSFVTVFEADGDEQWTWRHRSAAAEDEASAVAWGADGTLYVAGRSKSAMGGAAHGGGWDGYLQSFTTSDLGKPVVLSTTSFGASDDQAVAGLAVRDGKVVVASTEGGRGVLRGFDTSGAAPSLAATHDLGALAGGRIAGVAFDGAEVVVAGSTGSGGLSGGTVAGGHSGGQDAFVARLGADLTPQRVAYWGGAGDEQVTAVTVKDGQVWLAGSSGGDLPGATKIGARDGFLARLDDATGQAGLLRRWTGKDGEVAPSTIAIDPRGSSVLDRLGLPSAAVDTAASDKVVAQTAARAGDQLFVSVGGGARRAVTVEAGDTFRTLAQKITRALGFAGSASVKRDSATGLSTLQIVSRNAATRIDIAGGAGGRDALEALGLVEGEVRTLPTGVKEIAGEPKTYGLSLTSDLSLADKAAAKRANDQLQAALSTVRTAYRDLKALNEPKTAATGQAPAYLTSQIANYQAALARLGG